MRIISLFTKDFRLLDNWLLEGWQNHEIIPLYLYDDLFLKDHGDNFKSLFSYYVKEFADILKNLGSKLYFTTLRDFNKFLDITKPDLLRHSLNCEPYLLQKRKFIEHECQKRGIKVESSSQFLIPPTKKNFKKRFTAFYKNIFKPFLLQNPPIVDTIKPKYLLTPKIQYPVEPFSSPQNPYIIKLWYKSEEEVQQMFKNFLTERLHKYATERDYPALDTTSKLSIYIRLGIISLRYIYSKLLEYRENDKFLQELAWSEFFRVWICLNQKAITSEYKSNWKGFPWRRDSKLFEKWKVGETGFRLIDAGMRQLNLEGWIHNRVRMVSASFLTKNLMVDWRLGERYFFENLLDADIAQNVGNWQWVAGCGLDSAPYFRVFNPDLQLQKYDPDKFYVSRYTSENLERIVDFQKSKIEFLKLANNFLKKTSTI